MSSLQIPIVNGIVANICEELALVTLEELLGPYADDYSNLPLYHDGIERSVNEYASFSGDPIVSWPNADRVMKLEKDFSFTPRNGELWFVPAGTIIDGASIPQVLWSLVGSPYTGLYRDASIVHDHFCVNHSRTWQDTHMIFFEGMMCAGVHTTRAKLMYFAVYRFGPRWKVGAAPEGALESSSLIDGPAGAKQLTDFRKSVGWIMAAHPSLDEIRSHADADRS